MNLYNNNTVNRNELKVKIELIHVVLCDQFMK